jgi:hypothetical protein
MPTHPRAKVLDIPTLIAVGIVAWALVNMLHEIVGHGGAAALLGIEVHAASTTTVSIAWNQIEEVGEYRLIHAAGALVNLLTGALALIALRWRNAMSGPWRCFLWLFASFSAIVIALNLASAPLIGGTTGRNSWRSSNQGASGKPASSERARYWLWLARSCRCVCSCPS